MKIVSPSVSLEWVTPNAAQIIEKAGRTCYMSGGLVTAESATKFIEKIKRLGHESVIEHASASFRIICDRGVSHEIVRHRLVSYSQESTRYVNYSKEKFGNEITVICPFGIEKEISDESYNTWVKAMENAEKAYFSLLATGCKAQLARSVLPTCLKTEIVMTCNFREWRHFLRLRTNPAAHPQMREVANMIKDILIAQCPAIFETEIIK